MVEREPTKILIASNHQVARWWLRDKDVDPRGWRVVVTEQDLLRLHGWEWREGDEIVWYTPMPLSGRMVAMVKRELRMSRVPEDKLL